MLCVLDVAFLNRLIAAPVDYNCSICVAMTRFHREYNTRAFELTGTGVGIEEKAESKLMAKIG
jgi:hypothetical protein